jgi:tRNA pseudouridine38-40 synthase
MNAAAAALLGCHDFAAFCKRREGATTIRTLLELSWWRDRAGVLAGTVVADAFCHHMVRGLAGCLVVIGEGRRPPGWAREILDAGVRSSSVPVLPAHGLTLEEVGYPRAGQLAARALESRAMRAITDG